MANGGSKMYYPPRDVYRAPKTPSQMLDSQTWKVLRWCTFSFFIVPVINVVKLYTVLPIRFYARGYSVPLCLDCQIIYGPALLCICCGILHLRLRLRFTTPIFSSCVVVRLEGFLCHCPPDCRGKCMVNRIGCHIASFGDISVF
ncbi:hypothetical protein ACFX14_025953 [Malus domestica]